MPPAAVFIWLTLEESPIRNCVVMKLLMWFKSSPDPCNKFQVDLISLSVCQLDIEFYHILNSATVIAVFLRFLHENIVNLMNCHFKNSCRLYLTQQGIIMLLQCRLWRLKTVASLLKKTPLVTGTLFSKTLTWHVKIIHLAEVL